MQDLLRMGVRVGAIAAGAGAGACLFLAGCSEAGSARNAENSPTAIASPGASPAELSAPALPAQLVLSTEAWTFAGKPGKVITTPSYRIFTTADWPWMIDSMPRFLETALGYYSTALGPLPRPTRAMDTYLMANRPQWLDLCRSVLGPDDRSFEQIQRGGVTLGGRALLYNVGPRDTFALVAHEGWHQYTQTVLKDPLPVWLEEGIATYMEGYRWNRQRTATQFEPWRNFERFEALRRASDRGRLLSLQELVNTTPQDELARSDERALTYYAQVWALVHFLREGESGKYAEPLADALMDASRSRLTHHLERTLGGQAARSHMMRRRGPQLIQAYCTADLAMADQEYAAFISQVVKPGAAQAIAEGRSPLAK
ncbi:MAG TPA: DUF1570 domain-containing protein [Phycisphaerales bacterium]|nr:DUF1570 domain-containing protein [Phycisphaerales bacterium]